MHRVMNCCTAAPCSFDAWPVRGGQLQHAGEGEEKGEDKEGGACASLVHDAEHHDVLAIGHVNSEISLWHLGRGDCFHCLGRVHSLAMLDTGDLDLHGDKKVSRLPLSPYLV